MLIGNIKTVFKINVDFNHLILVKPSFKNDSLGFDNA